VSPRLAEIIRVNLSDLSPLLRIQQAMPSTRTERRTAAASAGIPDLAAAWAVSTPAAVEPVFLSILLIARRSSGDGSAGWRSSG
jgi:hypothetical protein